MWMLRYLGVVALFLVVYWLVLRPVKKQVLAIFRELPGKLAASAPQVAAAAPAALGTSRGLDEDGKRASLLKQQISEKVKAEPASASRLIQGWMREPSQ